MELLRFFKTFCVMPANFFTLTHVARDLNATIRGRVCPEIFSQTKNELLLCIDGVGTLVVSCEPALNAVYLRKPVARARKNSMDFFPEFHGTTIAGVAIAPSDREIAIDAGRGTILIQCFGPKANVLLVNERRECIDSFLHRRELAGTGIAPPAETPPLRSLEEFRRRAEPIRHLPSLVALKALQPLFGRVLLREVFTRAGMSEEKILGDLPDRELRALFESAEKLRQELLGSPAPRIYMSAGQPVALAITGLQSMKHLEEERFDSLHDAVREFVSAHRKARGFLKARSDLEARLKQETDRAGRALSAMAQEVDEEDRASQYELFGKLLLADPAAAEQGASSARLENIFSPNRELVTIPLDPHLKPSRNAERYFSKAKKIRQSLEQNKQRKRVTRERYELLKHLSDALDEVQDSGQWDEFLRTMKDNLREAGLAEEDRAAREKLPPFRIFEVEGGFQVWAGKNSENNDLLTLKHARPNDLWFHARGSGGSHVVLRMGTGKGEVSKRAIEQAAAIAAYYSKMKTSGLVPVAMTLRKYVRKPKGAPAGTVAIEREKVLMVKPGLPDLQHSSSSNDRGSETGSR